MVFELLMADQPEREESHDPASKFWNWVDAMGVTTTRRYPGGDKPAADVTHSAISVNLDACINCGLCVRACREVQMNDVIGMAYRGHGAKVIFDFDKSMGESTCVACGECVQVCPTGALMEKNLLNDKGKRVNYETKSVDTLCPYCGVGCQTTVHVKDNKILYIDGRDGPANNNRLCVKGRFGFDYIHHPDRLTKPLIRRDGVAKDANMQIRRERDRPSISARRPGRRRCERAAGGLKTIHTRDGGKALAGFGSAKGSNEEAYLFQKLIRQGFGTNNVDHCTRLCHASSVAALMEGLNSGAVTAPFTAAKDSDCIIVIGARPAENHPVAATFLKNAAARGAKLIVMDPRGQNQGISAATPAMCCSSSRAATSRCSTPCCTSSSTRAWSTSSTCRRTPRATRASKAKVADFTPEKMEPVCGIPAATIREVARLYARSERSLIFWGMGISQHTHGTDNARCLIALALVTGQIGRPGTGLHPLRGQNNVQGASDAGLIPMVFPDYKSVEDPAIRGMYEEFWGTTLPPKRGLTVVEIMHAIHDGEIKGMYVMGENPGHVRSRRAARPRGAGPARMPGGAGHLPHRDRLARRRGAAGLRACREVGHLHQHQPSGADRATGDRSAGRRTAGLGADPVACAGHRPQLELQACIGGVRRDGRSDAIAQEHHLGTARARGRRNLPVRCARPARQRDPLLTIVPDQVGPRQDRASRSGAAR